VYANSSAGKAVQAETSSGTAVEALGGTGIALHASGLWRQVIWIDCRSGTTAARAP
jgi:hypothetical protein